MPRPTATAHGGPRDGAGAPPTSRKGLPTRDGPHGPATGPQTTRPRSAHRRPRDGRGRTRHDRPPRPTGGRETARERRPRLAGPTDARRPARPPWQGPPPSQGIDAQGERHPARARLSPAYPPPTSQGIGSPGGIGGKIIRDGLAWWHRLADLADARSPRSQPRQKASPRGAMSARGRHDHMIGN